jgi:hypothetical protein
MLLDLRAALLKYAGSLSCCLSGGWFLLSSPVTGVAACPVHAVPAISLLCQQASKLTPQLTCTSVSLFSGSSSCWGVIPRDSFSLLVKAALSGARMVHSVALVRLAAMPEACRCSSSSSSNKVSRQRMSTGRCGRARHAECELCRKLLSIHAFREKLTAGDRDS